jgi:predicted permease
MRSVLPDLRYALRQLSRSPSFTVTAVAVLALGLGANIAVFTLVNGILLRPLPYAHAERIAAISTVDYPMSYANMFQLRDAAGSALQIEGQLDDTKASVVGPGGRIEVRQVEVTAGLFSMLGVQPFEGRGFRDDENDPGRNHVAVLSADTWRKLYNSDPQIVSKTLTIKGRNYTILGVMPKGFSFPYDEAMQVWTPAALDAASRSALNADNATWGDFYLRIPDGMDLAQLAAQLNRKQALLVKEHSSEALAPRINLLAYQDSLNHQARRPLTLLYVVVFGIWLLACLNVTNLMVARAVARTREQAVRTALGASSSRLLQQSILESLVLSGLGSGLGLLVGQSAIKFLWRQIERNLPLAGTVQVDWRVLSCLAILTLITAMLVGVFPALRAMHRDVQSGLRGVAATASASQRRTRELLVVGQLALTVVFLVGAGLFLRTIHALRQVPLGFSQQNVLTGGIILNGVAADAGDKSAKANVISGSYEPLLERLRAIPGVKQAALSSVLPMRAEFSVGLLTQLDHKKLPPSQAPRADARLASAGLVEALGIPMLRGRFFTAEDTASAPFVAVVNDAFASKYLAGEDPVGHTLSMGEGRFSEIRIVGVIGDMKQSRLTEATKPEVYFCLAQMGPGTPTYGVATAFIQVAIRGLVPAETLRAQFDRVLHEVAPDATTTDVKTIHQAVEDSFGSQTLIARLLESFAALALVIASVGLYGLLTFSVAQRTREIGVRLALGTPHGNVVGMVLGRALLLVVSGLFCGAVMAWFAVRFAQSYVYGVRVHDAVTFVVVILVLTAASFLAAWLPARRAASIDPILALRSE